MFKAHAGVPLAPKELRSSFITFLRSGHNSDAALKSAAFAMRHSSAQARGPAYDKERSERLSAAVVQVATDFAAGFQVRGAATAAARKTLFARGRGLARGAWWSCDA